MKLWAFYHEKDGFDPIPQLFATSRNAMDWAAIWEPEKMARDWKIREVKLALKTAQGKQE